MSTVQATTSDQNIARPHYVTGNRQRDVANALFREAETRTIKAVQELLPAHGPWQLVDRRDHHLHGDFWLVHQNGRTLVFDIKCDQYLAKTGRVAFEEKIVFPDGHSEQGWGVSRHVDLAIFVSPLGEQWPATTIAVEPWLHYVDGVTRRFTTDVLYAQYNWRVIRKTNTDGRVAHGWAMPLEELRRERLVYRDFLV